MLLKAIRKVKPQLKQARLLVILLLSPIATLAMEFPPSPVNVAVVQMKSLSPSIWVSGTVVSPNNAQIAAEVPGRLIFVAAIGTRVKSGEVIAQIDDNQLQLNLAEQQANVNSATYRLAFLESEVSRISTLATRNLSAKNELDQTLSNRDVAKGELAAAKARLAITSKELADSKLQAPFNGIVTERIANQGEYVSRGAAIVRLVETDELEATAQAPLATYPFLKKQSALVIKSSLGEVSVPVKSLVPVASSRSHLMEIRLDLSHLDWPIGLSLRAAVVNGEQREVLAVPRDALVLRRDGASVFRVNDESLAEKITVSTGIGAGDFIEVFGDLTAGDRVIIRGAERLQPMQPVAIKENNNSLISGNQ